MVDKTRLQNRILELASQSSTGLSAQLTVEFGISRQTLHRHINELITKGLIEGSGTTSGREYHLALREQDTKQYKTPGMNEDFVWRDFFAARFRDALDNVRAIWQYGITEMVNNAIDHSGSAAITVGIRRNALYTDAWVADEGEGIFRKIQRAMGLYDPREAILELVKGKLTTEPKRHTGEGIFFTSKVFDRFDIISGNLHFLHDGEPLDILLERPTDAPGTVVLMRLANASTRTSRSIFDKFAAPEEYNFSKTIVPVRLALYEGETLVSRSQAKRVYLRFERFQNVVLDFEGIDEIGQAFADELFRVFVEAHPAVNITPVNMNKAVQTMFARITHTKMA
jgi:hypothetical protein